ncbi:ATP-binding protein [Methylibium sp.]|uniref:sensor histidine kinase n=1 Tax=Methylibium sp. TaxID=2067992 RepID=UPI003D0B20CB
MLRHLPAPSRLLFLLWLGLLGCLLASGPARGQGADVLTLRTAQAASVPSPTPTPPVGGGFEAVALPDDWVVPHVAGEQVVKWYRLRFDAPQLPAGTLLAAYVPRVCSNLEVYLNGQLLLRGGSMREPMTRNCYHSQLVSLPASLLRPAGNELELQVAGFALARVSGRQRAGGLSEVLIGPYPELSDLHERQRFWNVTFAQIVAATLVMIGVAMLALGWVRRVVHLIYFGVVSLGWALLSARIWWRDIPLPHGTLELLSCIAFIPLSVCGVLFLLRYCGVKWRAADIALWAQCLVMPAGLLLAGPDRLFAGAVLCYSVLALEVFAAIGFCLAHIWRTRRREFWLFGTILALVGVVIGIEVGIQDRLLNLPSVNVFHFVIPLLFCVLAFRLVQTFAQALTAAEDARHQLEQRVYEISAEIERNFSHLAEVRVEQVAEKERKRIAADLHDDLGAKLLTIVHTSNDERISTLAREALEEMRLSVRGIAGKPVQLADALADWRAETVSRLGDAGIEIEWHSTEPSTPRTLAARSYVQTTRVLREATSNLIKHSGASRASVTCRIGDEFQLVIRDNGRGIPLELDGRLDRGHGMASMKHRAKQMQGQCLIESGPGYGTVIRLTLPL